MKKLLLLLLGTSFLTFSSCADKKEKTVTTADESVLELEEGGCPECTVQYFKCLEHPNSVYMGVVEKATDRLRAKSITNQEYEALCEEAYSMMHKAVEECGTIFEKCCLEE